MAFVHIKQQARIISGRARLKKHEAQNSLINGVRFKLGKKIPAERCMIQPYNNWYFSLSSFKKNSWIEFISL